MSRRPPDRSAPPPAGEPRPLELPPVHEAALANGMRVLTVRRAAVPEVSLQLLLEAGAAADPRGREGLASLTARLLREGAGDRDAPAMAEWLGRLGAGFSVRPGHDTLRLSLHCLPEVLPEALDFLADVVRRPRFDRVEVERLRAERLDEIARRRDDAADVAAESLARAVFGEHPYGTPSRGVPETVGALDGEAIRSFHAARYRPATAALIACGAVEPAAVEDAVEERFGDWRPGDGERIRPPEALPPAGEAVLLVHQPESRQAEIRVGTVGLARGAPDEFAARMTEAILGGVFNSRLNMNLREDKGWTYGARAGFSFRRAPGPFVARSAVETEHAADALEETLAEIEGMMRRPPSDEEMRLAVNALTLSLPRQFETAHGMAAKVADRVVHGLPEDYWERFGDRIRAVGREAIVDVVERRLPRETLVLLAVGDADRLREPLARLGPVEEVSRPTAGGGAVSATPADGSDAAGVACVSGVFRV